MIEINKRISSSRERLQAGTLEDISIPLSIDPLQLNGESLLKASIVLRVNSVAPVPSSIEFSIVDNNRQVEKSASSGSIVLSDHTLISKSLSPENLDNGTSINECTLKLVDGEPSLSVVVNSNEPILDDSITISYRVIALYAF